MLNKKTVMRAAFVGMVLLTGQLASAQSDSARIEKLERAVEMLEKQNADLKAEVNSLKSHSMSSPIIEGKTKTEVSSDGKNYVEKVVPASALESAEKWKLFPAITELELFGDLRLRY